MRDCMPSNKTGLTYRQVKTSRPERIRTGLAHARTHARAHAHAYACGLGGDPDDEGGTYTG